MKLKNSIKEIILPAFWFFFLIAYSKNDNTVKPPVNNKHQKGLNKKQATNVFDKVEFNNDLLQMAKNIQNKLKN